MMVREELVDHNALKDIASYYEISVPELCRFYLKLGIKDAKDDGIVSPVGEIIKKTKWYMNFKGGLLKKDK